MAITWETKNTQREVGYIGKCRTCKTGFKRTVLMAYKRTYRSDHIGAVSSSDRNLTPWPDVTCCGRRVEMKTIKGHTTDQPCDARCTSATGPVCECSCGGRNHGGNHA